MTATYTKLKDGSWGIRVVSVTKVTPGAAVTVTTKAGKQKTEVIGKVLWTGNGVNLCTIASSTQSRSSSRDNGAYDGSCANCRFARQRGQEACRQCLFDEYDD